jgi:hypothetical protein
MIAFFSNLQFKGPGRYRDCRIFRLQIRPTFVSVTLFRRPFSISWYYDELHHERRRR